jgi:hypothetical protein
LLSVLSELHPWQTSVIPLAGSASPGCRLRCWVRLLNLRIGVCRVIERVVRNDPPGKRCADLQVFAGLVSDHAGCLAPHQLDNDLVALFLGDDAAALGLLRLDVSVAEVPKQPFLLGMIGARAPSLRSTSLKTYKSILGILKIVDMNQYVYDYFN